MGVHDFVCYIQRNGQSVSDLVTAEEEAQMHADCQNCNIRDCDQQPPEGMPVRATIVTLPANLQDEIWRWPLTRFREYPAVEEDYSWDDWDFEGPHGDTGYRDALMGDGDWPEFSMWTASGQLHVVFQTAYYKAFVLGEDPEYISWHTYSEIFDNRQGALPATKLEAWLAVTSGETKPPVVNYYLTYDCEPWEGKYIGPPVGNIKINGVEIIHCQQTGRQCIIHVLHRPELPEYAPDGCIVCGGQREYGEAVCDIHEDTQDARIARRKLAADISQQVAALYAVPRPAQLMVGDTVFTLLD